MVCFVADSFVAGSVFLRADRIAKQWKKDAGVKRTKFSQPPKKTKPIMVG